MIWTLNRIYRVVYATPPMINYSKLKRVLQTNSHLPLLLSVSPFINIVLCYLKLIQFMEQEAP